MFLLQITPAGMRVLARAFMNDACPYLTHIDLSYNEIQDEGIGALLEVNKNHDLHSAKTLPIPITGEM